MKALVVGFGSIGRRHVRLLEKLSVNVGVVSRRNVGHSPTFPDIPTGLSQWLPDYVVLASQTHEHLPDLRTLKDSNFDGKILIEKPLFDWPSSMPFTNFPNVNVAYNFRFHPALLELKELLSSRTVYAVQAHAGQYLPDWRPQTDYRKSYSADRERGGGVLRDLSHELDYLCWILGEWHEIFAIGDKSSNLEISSDDNYSLLIRLEKCPSVAVHLNYLDGTLTRFSRFLTDAGTVHLDLASGVLSDAGERANFEVDRDFMYLEQHKAVLGYSSNDNLCTYKEGLSITQMIAAAEQSSASKTPVHNQWMSPQ